jgi:hypothetical protein
MFCSVSQSKVMRYRWRMGVRIYACYGIDMVYCSGGAGRIAGDFDKRYRLKVKQPVVSSNRW